jgi:hypothetical protein
MFAGLVWGHRASTPPTTKNVYLPDLDYTITHNALSSGNPQSGNHGPES